MRALFVAFSFFRVVFGEREFRKREREIDRQR